LTHEINPTAVVNIASYIHREQSAPARAEARGWVVEVDGRAVGRVECFRNFFTEGSRNGFLNVAVLGEHRRQGLGRALYEVGLRYAKALELGEVLVSFHENEAGIAFATGLGFTEVRAEEESVLDPRTVREAPSPEVDLRPVSAVDPQLVHAVDLEATLDMPQTEAVDDIPYDEWEDHVLRHPLFTPEGSFVAMVDGVAAAVSLLVVDVESGRSHNMFTGTLRAYRGRGLGLAVKLASIQWAAANGVTMMATNNDETNAPMLAINRRLGYVPGGRRVEYLKVLK
jgi:GNAT superfamily N-acetyltransferase